MSTSVLFFFFKTRLSRKEKDFEKKQKASELLFKTNSVSPLQQMPFLVPMITPKTIMPAPAFSFGLQAGASRRLPHAWGGSPG